MSNVLVISGNSAPAADVFCRARYTGISNAATKPAANTEKPAKRANETPISLPVRRERIQYAR